MPIVQSLVQQYQQQYPNKILIAGVDELSQTNGILFKIKAFHQLLKEIPAFRSHLVLIQVCFQQRTASSVYHQYENQITEAATACNEQFPGTVDLRVLSGSFIPIEDRIALWKVSRIYLNTSLSQGLNLHPQEFLLTRKQEGGTVIVSEFASSHEFLNGALAVNPWNIQSIVSQLEKAIEMSLSEVKLRQQRDIDSISKRERRLWASNVISNVLLANTEEMIQTAKLPGQDNIVDEQMNVSYRLNVFYLMIYYF